jgi:hypothetical protein
MRRLVVALVVVMFGASFAGLNGRPVAAQNSPDEVARALEACPPGRPPTEEELARDPNEPWFPWEGVCQPISETEGASIPFPVDPGNPDAPARSVQPFAVAFTMPNSNTARIGVEPLDRELGLVAEFMVIYVRDGTFAIDPEQGDGTVVVSTLNEEIPTLTPWNETRALNQETPYEPTGVPLTVNGDVCTRACPVTPGTPVALYPGDIAIAEEGAICLYCLIGNGQIGGEQIGTFQDDYVKGLLEVYPLLPGSDPNDFSWIRSWEIHQQTQYRNDDAKSGMIAWALFNPPSGCH